MQKHTLARKKKEDHFHQQLMQNSLIHSDEELVLKLSAFESLYGGQCTLSTQSIEPNVHVSPPPPAPTKFH